MKRDRLPVSSEHLLDQIVSYGRRAPEGLEALPVHALIRMVRNAVRMTQSQLAARADLITALSLLKVAGRLHSHKVAGKTSKWDDLYGNVDRAVATFGASNFRANIKTFYELIDECWGIRNILHKNSAAYLRGTFLDMLAQLLSDHVDFWRADAQQRRLMIDVDLRRKIASFPIRTDKAIITLAASAGKAREHLYLLMRDHINSGKRTRRLTPRDCALIAAEEPKTAA